MYFPDHHTHMNSEGTSVMQDLESREEMCTSPILGTQKFVRKRPQHSQPQNINKKPKESERSEDLCNVCGKGNPDVRCSNCTRLIHSSTSCSMPSPSQNFSEPPATWKMICKSCYCLLCKQIITAYHVCCCVVCSKPVGADASVICSSCERLVHQGSCSFSTCRETYMCHKCSFAQRLGLSESALMEINAGSYLSDEHVSIASSMLKEQFGAKFHGLNPPLPVRHNNEIVNELQYPTLICGDKDYVQIMHTGNQHWVTCIFQTASPNTAIVLDSLRKTKLSSFLCLQVAMVACSKEESITICRKPCQQQKGSVDCALFAIAQATEFCSSSEIRFIDFDQSKLREHWMSCVKAGKLTRFPAISSRPKKTLEEDDVVKIALFCKCRLPECFDRNMVMCDRCCLWFHYRCYNLQAAPEGEWFCSQLCKDK